MTTPIGPLWPLWAAALALLLTVLAALIWPLLAEPQEPPAPDADARARLLALYRAQREELEREFDRQTVAPGDRQQALDELDRGLLEDTDRLAAAPPTPLDRPRHRRVAAALLSALLPLAALALYLEVGDPKAVALLAAGTAGGDHAAAGADVDTMVARLEARLRSAPDDIEGWLVLARSREAQENYAAASEAYRTAVDLARRQSLPAEFQARLLADLADALASSRNGALDGPVQAALDEALKLDAHQAKALALAGAAAVRRADIDAARTHWQRLLALLEPGSDIALRVQSDIARLDKGAPAQAAAPAAPPKPAARSAAGIAGTVRLAPALAARVQPGDTLFIVARAAQTGRVPVAVLRLPADRLPAAFALDDSHAMSPELPLSRFDELTVEARISRSGSAQRQAGQPISAPQAVRRGSTGVAIMIDAVER
ncbi:c-type cytochrome biogenesis protein CcmI [Xylophilus sp.]|uniref:c-type cytochrome biogenesis protein CcmI n=1 Tax=Xylophilus sp. TaxID=2653893 RepID=UPI0013BD985E|nr:c-type cytochrome biogenesis protein CcmI [Xylophilus sp.]KAF1050145.1 MAG: hypothetical protein GAK38_00171 [Xylophilus sp.]